MLSYSKARLLARSFLISTITTTIRIMKSMPNITQKASFNRCHFSLCSSQSSVSIKRHINMIVSRNITLTILTIIRPSFTHRGYFCTCTDNMSAVPSRILKLLLILAMSSIINQICSMPSPAWNVAGMNITSG